MADPMSSTAGKARGAVLVTGATGFVGQALVRRLAASGTPVHPVVRRAAAQPADGTLKPLVVEDLLEADLDRLFAAPIEVVVHLAARVHQMNEPPDIAERAHQLANTQLTRLLAEAAERHGVRRFVYLSSIKVNGEETRGQPFTAADPPAPVDAYGRSKRDAEQQLQAIANRAAMSVAVIWPCLVVGPGAKGNLRSLAGALSRGIPLPLGAVRNRRSLISLDNLIDLILAAMNHPFYGYRLGLAADDRDLSSAEIAGAIAKGMGVTPWLPPVPIAILKGLGALTGRAAAAQRLVADLQVDNGDAKSAFDWRPEQDPAASLALTGAACRDNAPSLVKV